MRHSKQFLFLISLLVLSWLGMQAVHESGHVLAAKISGGAVQKVELHPLRISRTDVAPNPFPAIVVWSGPIVGCSIPLLLELSTARCSQWLHHSLRFFSGFCLIANGAYIGIGAFERIGDCGVMLQTGSPRWALFLFGAVTVPLGLFQFHRLGSPRQFFSPAAEVSTDVALGLALAAITVVGIAAVFG